jgi:hypothetical protein
MPIKGETQDYLSIGRKLEGPKSVTPIEANKIENKVKK